MKSARTRFLATGLAAAFLLVLGVDLAYGPAVRYAGGNCIRTLNKILSPSGFDEDGVWKGPGSGIVFSSSEPHEGLVSLDLKTPYGTFSLPYTCEEPSETPPEPRLGGRPTVDPSASVRFAGTGFAASEPIVFTFANSSGAAGPVSVHISKESVQIAITTAEGAAVWTFKDDGSVAEP